MNNTTTPVGPAGVKRGSAASELRTRVFSQLAALFTFSDVFVSQLVAPESVPVNLELFP